MFPNAVRNILFFALTLGLITAISLPTLAPPPVKEITIKVGEFFWEGPDGKSSSHDNPAVIATLKNGEHVKITIQNVGQLDHQIISPLFSAPVEKVRVIKPRQKMIIDITPNFRSVADGTVFEFELSCHMQHGTVYDHYFQGLRAILRVAK